MSDGATKRFSEKEDYGIPLSRSDIGETSYRKHSLWMAHWSRDGNSAEPQNGKSCSPFGEIDDISYSKDCGNLPFELMKARVAERLMVGVTHGGAPSGNIRQFSSNMWGVTHDVYQEVQCKNTDQFNISLERSMMNKNMKLYAAKTVVSEKVSVHKPSGLSLNSYKLLSCDNLSSEWSHFPLLAINRKIDSILKPRRSALVTSSGTFRVPQKSLNPNMCTSNVMTFSKEYQFHMQQVADENMSHCKFAGGSLYHLDDCNGLNSDHSEKKLRGNLTAEGSCSCSKDETTSSFSLADEGCSDHYFNPKENKIVEDSILEQNLGASKGCQKQQYFEEVQFQEPLLAREYKKSVNTSSISKGTDVDINGHGVVFEQHRPRAPKVDYTVNLTESCRLPDSVEKTLTMKSESEALVCKKLPKENLKYIKQKGVCLFEVLTVPSQSHVTYSKYPIYSGKSRSTIGSLLGAQKQHSAKTDTLYSDSLHASKSTAGFASSSMQKLSWGNRGTADKASSKNHRVLLMRPNSEKTERVLTSSVKGVSSCCEGNETANVGSEHQNSNSKPTWASKEEWSIPKTSSMNLDLVLFQISRMGNPISKALAESSVCSDPSDEWLNRLKRDSTSDHQVLCSKRQKTGSSSPPGKTCPLFGGLFDRDRGNTSVIKHAKEDQLTHEGLMEQKNKGSPISSKSLNHWIGRWCQGGTPSFHGTSHLGKQLCKSNMPPDDCLDSQFPSIGAMAMMGRVMNKLRPCELEKKGPAVVWKTDGL